MYIMRDARARLTPAAEGQEEAGPPKLLRKKPVAVTSGHRYIHQILTPALP